MYLPWAEVAACRAVSPALLAIFVSASCPINTSTTSPWPLYEAAISAVSPSLF